MDVMYLDVYCQDIVNVFFIDPTYSWGCHLVIAVSNQKEGAAKNPERLGLRKNRTTYLKRN